MVGRGRGVRTGVLVQGGKIAEKPGAKLKAVRFVLYNF